MALQASIREARSDAGLAAVQDVRAENKQLLATNLLAEQAATANQVALDLAVKASQTDPLTGLRNRSVLSGRLSHELDLASRLEHHVGVLLLDLNDFKQLNDRHGHAFGDLVLQRVASVLTAAVRASDTVCRLGGDEFVVVASAPTRDGVNLNRSGFCGGPLGSILQSGFKDARGVPRHRSSRRYILGHHRPGADQRVIADRYAGHDECAAADPHVLANLDGPSELQTLGTERSIARVICGEDLHRRAGLRHVANFDIHHIEDDAAEVHEHPAPDLGVVAIVEVQRWPNGNAITGRAKHLAQHVLALGAGQPGSQVVSVHPFPRSGLVGLDFCISGVVILASQHLLLLGLRHGRPSQVGGWERDQLACSQVIAKAISSRDLLKISSLP